jgi:2-dehydropantoate 2-reductase
MAAMKIAVYGTGGVGGYFGGLLAHVGHDVVFIARGDHLAAIQSAGLRVHSIHGDFAIQPAQATDDPGGVGAVDYVIVAVKHYSLAAAAPGVAKLVGPETTVVPLLNGVNAHEILEAEVPRRALVGGLCSIVSMIESPGVIRQESQFRSAVVGEFDHRRSDRVERLVQAWKEGGAEATQADDIHVAMWNKLIFIASFGGVGALARANAGELRANPETRQLIVDAAREVEAVGRAEGVELATDATDRAVSFFDNIGPTSTSSMQRDVAAGLMFELEAFSGTVVRRGQANGVPTPVHQMIYALLLPAMKRAMKT